VTRPALVERCSDGARERVDPMVGTAAPARRWLLVEHPGPWPPDALAGSGIAPPVQTQLTAAAASARARILLVRRPEGRSRGVRDRVWAVLDHAEGAPQVWGIWRDDADLLDAAAELGSPPTTASTRRPGGDPLLLVCAHGRHDVCCAVRGRPVAAALAEHWPEVTWECSHVGGDRFAANLLVVPDGAYYGNLDPASAVAAVEGHLAGEVVASALRGVSGVPPAAQAAVVAALERYGPTDVRAFTASAPQRLPDGAWQVVLEGRPRSGVPERVVARVSSSVRPPAHLTCRALRANPATSWTVTDLTP
jgi:hypothetical protein